MIRAVIDGRPVEVAGGTMILAALERAGIHVPHLCEDERIAPIGACRLCLVRVAGVARPVASCVTALADGMVIETRTPALEEERRPRDVLEVSPADAERLSLAEGDLVEIESRHGRVRLPVHVDPAIQVGQLFATFHSPEAFVNRVTGSEQDPITHTPEYKRTAVRIQPTTDPPAPTTTAAR